MAGVTDISDKFDVRFGLTHDVCFYCLKEAMKNKEYDDPAIAREKLKGRLNGEKIWKLKHVDGVVVCKKHLQEIQKLMEGEED